jgi:hypothetical protein
MANSDFLFFVAWSGAIFISGAHTTEKILNDSLGIGPSSNYCGKQFTNFDFAIYPSNEVLSILFQWFSQKPIKKFDWEQTSQEQNRTYHLDLFFSD